MGKLFGTDGVRGIANTQLTSKLAYRLGYCACMKFTRLGNEPTFVIGTDTRISKDMLFSALASGILSCGGKVINAGVISTPAVAVLTRHYRADAGIVISASHNPYEYNGIKFFDQDGFKLPDMVEEEIEEMILYNRKMDKKIFGKEVGQIINIENPIDIYIDYLVNKIGDIDLKGLKIVLDCANGATYQTAPKVFEKLGAEVISISDKPNGININDKCGSTYTKDLVSKVIKHKADFGFAFDGDADRLIAVDEKGNEVNGDQIMYVLAKSFKDINMLSDDTLVVTVMSNLGLKKALEKEGIKIAETRVGDRYVLQKMLEKNYMLGGEQSGHVICTYINSTGDGLASALLLAKIISTSKSKLSELVSGMKIYPQVLINSKVLNENKNKYKEDEEIISAIKEVEKKYSGNGRVLIRTSGTEPLVRVMIEGEDLAKIKTDAKALADLIEKKLS